MALILHRCRPKLRNMFERAADGEVFDAAGKTDILIRTGSASVPTMPKPVLRWPSRQALQPLYFRCGAELAAHVGAVEFFAVPGGERRAGAPAFACAQVA
jgi:hypothetical protein